MEANEQIGLLRLALPADDYAALGELIEAADWHDRHPGDAGGFKREFAAILERSRARGARP